MAQTVEKVDPKTGEVVLPEVTEKTQAVPMSFEEAIAAAREYGTADAVIIDPYTPLNKDKDELLARPFFIQRAKFMVDRATGNPYVNLWVVREDNALFRVTDGSTGMYSQIGELVQNRIDRGEKTPYHNFLIANGLTKSEYLVNEATKEVWAVGDPDAPKTGLTRAATYYLA